MVEETFEIKVNKRKKSYVTAQRPVPKELSLDILRKSPLPPNVEQAKLVSSQLEDFIVEQIGAENVDESLIAEQFVNAGVAENIRDSASKVIAESEDYNVPPELIEGTNAAISSLLEDWGLEQDVINQVSNVELETTETFGKSDADILTGNAVRVSKPQLLRKAKDFIDIYGDEYSIGEVYEALLTGTYVHEVGHRLDTILGRISNNTHYEWGNVGECEESPSERFAEGFAQSVLNDRQKEIKQKEWLIHLAKTQMLWGAVEKAKASNPDFNINKVFIEMKHKVEGDSQVHDFIESRQGLYVVHPVENYASPYPESRLREIVETRKK